FAHLLTVGILMGLSAAGIGAGAAAAQSYEQPDDRRVSDVLAPELATGPAYKVKDPVATDGYMYRFIVESQYGAFDVVGTGALRRLAREIHGIGVLRETKNSAAFTTAVADSAGGSFRFAKTLITNPVDTVSGVPRAPTSSWRRRPPGRRRSETPRTTPP